MSLGVFDMRNPYHSQGLAAGGSALLDAVTRGKVHLAKFILDAGEYDVVNTRDFKGKTPLIRAMYIKEEKTRGKATELLIARGANVNMMDDSGRTALSYACELRNNDVVKILVKNNVDPDIPDKKGNTPLIYSAMVGNDTAIEILIKSFRRLGLNVDHVNNNGLTALLIAAKNGFIESATILSLEGRACISFRDRDKGMNAEEWARSRGCSTPEVLPFSTNAALWNFKFSRHDVFASNSAGRAADETDAVQNEVDSSEEKGDKSNQASSSRQINMEELNRRLAEIQNKQVEWGYLHPSLAQMGLVDRLRHKRCSLPAIKFFNYSSRDDDTQSARTGTGSGSQQQQQASLLSVGPAAVHAAGKRHSCYPDSAMAPSAKEGLGFPPSRDAGSGGGGGGGGGAGIFLSVNQHVPQQQQPTALRIPNGDRAPPGGLPCPPAVAGKGSKVQVSAFPGSDRDGGMASASKIDVELDSSGSIKLETPTITTRGDSKKALK